MCRSSSLVVADVMRVSWAVIYIEVVLGFPPHYVVRFFSIQAVSPPSQLQVVQQKVIEMAKSAPQKPTSGSARIRFIMLEAEIPEGDLSQFTHAIQHALRPAAISVPSPRITSPPTQRVPDHSDEVEALADLPSVETAIEERELAEEATPTQAPRRSPPRTPKVLDIDLISEPSFATFADEKKPNNHSKRYLLVAAWFKQARGIDAITADHVYTCYRSVKWPCDVTDFAQPLRTLKHRQKMTQTDEAFVINHLGLQEVDELVSP
jgi:hypothetical protein